ncbi:hypothetical protein [Rhodoferax sp. TS-BS-61-7]|uniref:hypothetical protein n=1 Tax=Rhodoferax sp. TS-BS-61-7 TaxID=2094194 RepID=UPI0011B06D39|nr:hypothetical protein [Rhodoferax sp. TS-BS-61-7]
MTLNYTVAADDKQPYGSYRLDVYSFKANRRMVLFGKSALCQFIDLEIDHRVQEICERPILVPGIKPKKVVDFWALQDGVSSFYVFLSPEKTNTPKSWDVGYSKFREWVVMQKAAIVEVDPTSFESKRMRYDNWSVVLQHLAGHRSFLSDGLLERCEDAIKQPTRLDHIENAIVDTDPMLVRAAVFKLLISGRLVCDSMESKPMHPQVLVARP